MSEDLDVLKSNLIREIQYRMDIDYNNLKWMSQDNLSSLLCGLLEGERYNSSPTTKNGEDINE